MIGEEKTDMSEKRYGKYNWFFNEYNMLNYLYNFDYIEEKYGITKPISH